MAPDGVSLLRDGDGSYIVLLDDDPTRTPRPHIAVFADIDGGVTLDLVGTLHLGESLSGIQISVEQARLVMVALGASIAAAEGL